MFWRRFWQVWFVITFLVISYNSIFLNINNSEVVNFVKTVQINIFDIIYLYMSGISLVGIFGFAWNKKIFNKKFWRIFLPVLIVYNFVYSYISVLTHSAYLNNTSNHLVSLQFIALTAATISLFNILVYLPIVFYGFKRNNLWDNIEINSYSIWKIIFLFLTLHTIIPSYLFLLTHFISLKLYEQLDFISIGFALTGLYGFAWDKNFFNRIFWQIFLVAYTGWGIIYWFVLPHSEIINIMTSAPVTIGKVAMIIINVSLVFIPLFFYAFKTNLIKNPTVIED